MSDILKMKLLHHFCLVNVFFLALVAGSYLQLSLIRTPQISKSFELAPVQCLAPSNITDPDEEDYKQICYEKDITYSIPFIKEGLHYSLSADFTTPLSWLKSNHCQIENTNRACTRVTETVYEKVKEKTKHKSRLDKMAKSDSNENSAIIGSSQTIRGELKRQKSVSLIVKDSSRLNNFMQLIMLGLFIYGEKDNLTLTDTNFINAMHISPNLNSLSDGAISLRFDPTAQNSFLQQIFKYVAAVEKTVTVSLGTKENNITIGDLTAKYTRHGYSGIHWINLGQDQGYGRLPQVFNIGIGDPQEDKEDDTSEAFQATFTLSASYISFPEEVIQKAIIKKFEHEAVCKINANNYVQCSSTFKKRLQKLMAKKLVIGFKDGSMILPMERLVLKVDHDKRAIFNIKKSSNSWAVLGQPVFQQYYMAFDYVRNRIGFSQKRQQIDEFMIEIVTLVRFLCCTMVLGCCFICCYEPCNRIIRKINRKERRRGKGERLPRRPFEYRPVAQRNNSLAETIQPQSEQGGLQNS